MIAEIQTKNWKQNRNENNCELSRQKQKTNNSNQCESARASWTLRYPADAGALQYPTAYKSHDSLQMLGKKVKFEIG